MKLLKKLLVLILIMSICGCSSKKEETKNSFCIYSLKGPTSMGLVKLLEDNENSSSANHYESYMVTDASEVTAALINGKADIAMLPANAAANLYSRTNSFSVVSINTLGVLYIVENSNTINSISDLAGKTVYLTGQATTPEYCLRYLLKYYGIEDQVNLQFCSEATEVATLLKEGVAQIGLLPQPFVSSALLNNENLRIALDMTEQWALTTDESQLVTGVTVVRKEILEKYPQQIEAFLKEYEASINWVNENHSEAAVLIEKNGIIAKSSIALMALPYCNLVFINGVEMKTILEGYLKTLYDFNDKIVGVQMPEKEFYY